MGVFTRPDSPYYWIYLPLTRTKERTNFLTTHPENRALAEGCYQLRMQAVAKARMSGQRYRVQDARAPSNTSAQWCYIYFISDGDLVKIGRAVNVTKRLRAMQTSTVKPLTVLAAFLGHVSLEREIHRKFATARVRGEWFTLTKDLRSFIARRQRGADPAAEMANHSHRTPDSGESDVNIG